MAVRSDRMDMVLLAARMAFADPDCFRAMQDTFDDQEALDRAQAFVEEVTDQEMFEILQEARHVEALGGTDDAEVHIHTEGGVRADDDA